MVFVLGAILQLSLLGNSLRRLSYDLPFIVPSGVRSTEVVLVYLDEKSVAELHQPLSGVDRSIHARLLDRLTAGGARGVLFDFVFAAASEHDDEFAAALRRSGRTVLSASARVDHHPGSDEKVVIAPVPVLRQAAAGWGLASIVVDDVWGVRRLSTRLDEHPSAPRVLVSLLGQPRTFSREPWLNFYGPPDTIPGVSFSQALLEDGVPPDFFRGKVVVVGGRSSFDQLDAAKDDFAGPWTGFWERNFPGAEIHATALLNLLRHEWLERPAPVWEWACLAVTALFCGFVLDRGTPLRALGAAFLAMLALAAVALLAMREAHLWWAWLIPAGVQIPVGLLWSVGSRYFSEARRRAALRRAFSLYLSPHMADKIDAQTFDLTPGGKLVEATIMFTDLEGFTTLAEELDDPAELSAILIRYYSKTTACILENEGTIIKYMGDAVEAVWNAPVEDGDHAFRAVQAAWRLREVARFTARGRTIRTRVGIHTGPAFAGNLGSDFRFDYAVIGDTTNLTARLEALNKRFGTDVLLSDATFTRLGGRFVTRPLGRFRVSGKKQAVAIHELIGPAGEDGDQPWLTRFAEGLGAFHAGDLATAERRFQETRALHGGEDGPAGFYLQTIRELETGSRPPDWDGVIEFAGK